MGYGKQASGRNREPLMPFTAAAYLKYMMGGGENAELSTVIKGEARFFLMPMKRQHSEQTTRL